MEKLIELLEEFNKEMGWHPGLLYEGFGVRKGDLNFIFNHSEFPFIKWLVDNDKIDLDKVDKSWNDEMSFVDFKLDNIMEIRIKVVLMLLAISDTPIDDLISYLR